MKYSEILTEAKELLRDPKNWNKDGDYYRDGDDMSCYCIFGAINEITKTENISRDEIDFEQNTGTSSQETVEFNDDPNTTHQDLMNWFDKTIKEVKLREFVKHRLAKLRSQ